MIHVFRRFLPLLLGPAGALLGSLSGLALHQLLSRSVRYFWAPWLGWNWLIGLLVYPAIGFLIAIPFLSAYPGSPLKLRSEEGRAQDLHLRMWIAAFVSAYLPVGIGVLYSRWWGAPSLPIPFTDVYLYAGSRGDLMSVMVGIAVLAPFCAFGVERLLRGLPRILRLLVGPPVAALLAAGGVLAAALATGAFTTTWAQGEAYGTLMQPLAQHGWDTGLMLSLLTVVCGCFAGAFAAIGVGLPALAGLPDPTPSASRRRWALPVLAVGVSGVLAAVAMMQGFGADSVRGVEKTLKPGVTELVGTLVAPADQDVLELEADRGGFYLFEFPRPGSRGRHWVNIPGYELPSGRADRLRYLLEIPDYTPSTEVTIQPSWPTRTGVSEYSGRVRFEHVPTGTEEAISGRRQLGVGPGQLAHWSVDASEKPTQLVLDPRVAARWTFLAGRVGYTDQWSYTPGWSVVFLRVMVDGQEIHSSVLGDEGGTFEGETLLLAQERGGTHTPEVSVWLQPATRPGETLTVPVIAHGLAPGEPPVHARQGLSVITVAGGDRIDLRPEPGGAFASVSVHPTTGADVAVRHLGDDGAWHPLTDSLLMMGETTLEVAGPDVAGATIVLAPSAGTTATGAMPGLQGLGTLPR